MPIYEYICIDCLKLFDIMVELKENGKEIKCPYCDKPLQKKISTPNIVIK